jgi:hypothetical protein
LKIVAGESVQGASGASKAKARSNGEKQIPCGDDSKKGKGRSKGKGKGKKQIPFGDDSKKGNGNGKGRGSYNDTPGSVVWR